TFYNTYAICAFAAIGGGLFGFDISSMSGVLAAGYRQGGITASMPAGSLVGSLASSFIADRLSRRTAIQVAALIWIIGSVFQTATNGVALLCFGRVVSGFSIGVASAIVPVYQSEIAPKEIRGRVVSLQQWAITWGILIQYFIQYGASFVDGGPKDPNQGTSSFRIPWGIQMVPGFILFVGMFFFPYSPRWLASKDRWEEAVQVLAHLHGGGDVTHPKVLAEYKEIEEALAFEREQADTSFTALTKPRIIRRVILGMSIQMWSQLCGMNIMMYYIIYIMESASIASPLLTSSIQYILNVLMTLPAILYLDRFGRRPALLTGSLLMSFLLFISGALQASYGTYYNDPDKHTSWHIVGHKRVSQGVVACSYLFVASFATTWGPTSWTYPAEIFPARMFLTAPETKGKTLEEMDDVFDRGIPAWKTHGGASRLDKLQRDIEKGEVKVTTGRGHGNERGEAVEGTEEVETKA
ncbi:hypothetical protein GRF29_112g1617048, partial [Pseudopithomyces chartarum]